MKPHSSNQVPGKAKSGSTDGKYLLSVNRESLQSQGLKKQQPVSHEQGSVPRALTPPRHPALQALCARGGGAGMLPTAARCWRGTRLRDEQLVWAPMDCHPRLCMKSEVSLPVACAVQRWRSGKIADGGRLRCCLSLELLWNTAAPFFLYLSSCGRFSIY